MYNWLYEWTNQNPMWSRQQKAQNVDIIAGYFLNKGWTLESICAMLGNMEVEGLFNPAQWQIGHIIEDPNPYNDTGFGLVQWTPWQKYTDWCDANGYDWRNNYDYELDRIQYEMENGLQWQSDRPGIHYDESFYDFTQSTASLDYLTPMFFWCYEYGTPMLDTRIANAYYWWSYLTDNPPPPPGPGPYPGKKNKMNIMFYLKSREKRGY